MARGNSPWSVWATVGVVTLLSAACEPSSPTDPVGNADVPIRLTAVTVGTPINTLIVEVTAADLAAPLVFNLTVVNGVASGTIRIPPGQARTITVTAVDDQGAVTHEGSVTIDVRPGQNPPVQIRLAPRAGQVPVSVTFGNFGVVVSPAMTTIDLRVAAQLQLTVTVTDVNGQVVPEANVGWATTQPAVATVTATGLVTGVIPGTATIVATYEGVAGLSAISVIRAGPTAEICDATDNNLDGLIDEGLRYCLNGVPTPHSDGNACLAGFVDANADPADGCEVQLAGVWALTPAVTTTCTGNTAFDLVFPDLRNPTIDRLTTRLAESGQLSVEFLLGSISVSHEFPLEAISARFGGTGVLTGPFAGTLTVTGEFTGPGALTATLSLTGAQIHYMTPFGSADGTCLDVTQSVTGARLAN